MYISNDSQKYVFDLGKGLYVVFPNNIKASAIILNGEFGKSFQELKKVAELLPELVEEEEYVRNWRKRNPEKSKKDNKKGDDY